MHVFDWGPVKQAVIEENTMLTEADTGKIRKLAERIEAIERCLGGMRHGTIWWPEKKN